MSNIMPPGPLSYAGQVAVPFINRTGAPTSSNTQFQVPTLWINTAGKDAYLLVSVDLGTAEWVPIGGLPGQVENIGVDASTPPGTDPVVPDASQTIFVTGGQTAPGSITNVIQTNSLAANTYTIQIQQTSTAAAKTTTLNGVSHFNSAQFTNDEGFVSIVGGPAVTKFNVDANTGPGTDPVLPDGTGQVTVTGAQVAAGAVGANVIRTDSLAANTYTIEIQRSAAVGATASANNGVSHFDSAKFTVDANGFVSASGTGLGQTITGDTGGALSPTAGNWNIVSTTTNGIQTTGAGSTLTVAMASPYADGDFSFESQAGGATRTLTIQNTVDAASSEATQLIKVAGGSSGDAWTSWQVVGGQVYSVGIDNSVTDRWKLTNSASPSGGSDLLTYDQVTNSFSFFEISTNGDLSVRKTLAGADVNFVVENVDGSANSTASIGVLAIDTFGDCYVGYNANPTVGFCHGIDTSDSNKWKLNTAATVPTPSSGTNCMVVTTAGEVTFPSTPAFLVTANAQANVTGNNTAYTVLFANEIFDQNSDFASPNFTAPGTGRYSFQVCVGMNDLAAAASTTGNIQLVTSNRTYTFYVINPTVVRDLTSNALTLGGSVLADMDAADTAHVVVQYGGAGADNNDVLAFPNTFFSGKLEC